MSNCRRMQCHPPMTDPSTLFQPHSLPTPPPSLHFPLPLPSHAPALVLPSPPVASNVDGKTLFPPPPPPHHLRSKCSSPPGLPSVLTLDIDIRFQFGIFAFAQRGKRGECISMTHEPGAQSSIQACRRGGNGKNAMIMRQGFEAALQAPSSTHRRSRCRSCRSQSSSIRSTISPRERRASFPGRGPREEGGVVGAEGWGCREGEHLHRFSTP